MADDKLNLPPETKRTNYFTSQFLVEEDFRDEQEYHLGMRHLHNRALHIWGVVDGLVVGGQAGAQQVSVSAGMAIDKDGHEIIFPQPPAWTGTFDKSSAGETRDLFVVISYREDDQDPKYLYTGTGLTDKKYTRVVESWQLAVSANAPEDGSVIKLARLRVDQNGLVGAPDNTVRRMAGSSIPRGGWLGSNDLYIGANGNIGIGTITPTERLDVRSSTPDGLMNFRVANSDASGFINLFPGRTGDLNPAMTWKSNTPLRFATADSIDNGATPSLIERMRITGDGMVGIGAVPGQKLEVAGALKLSSNPTVSNDQLAAYFWNQANIGPTIAGGQFEVRTGGDTPRLRIDPSGKVGIGVNNPAALLQAGPTPANIGGATFFNDAMAMFATRESNVGAIPKKPVLVLARDGVNTVSYANFARFDMGIYGGYRTQLDIGLSHEPLNSEGNNTPVIMTLRSDGRVGIGTTAPVERLDVRSSLPDEVVHIKIANSDASGFVNLYPGRTSDLNAAMTWKSNTPMRFATADSLGNNQVSNFVERMRITGDGKLCIGTSDPGAAKMRIANSASDFADVTFSQAGSGQMETIGLDSGWSINARTSGKHLYLNRGAEANSNVLVGRSGKELLVRGSDGNVGVGNSSPLFKLSTADTDTIATGVLRLQNSYLGTQGNTGAYGIELTGIDNGTNGHDLRVRGRTSAAGSFSDLVTVKNAGNVGIGTTGPGSNINTAGYVKADASGRILELYSPGNESVLILNSGQNVDAAHLGGLYFTRGAGQSDAHREVAAIKCRQTSTGPLAGGSLQFFTKGNGDGVTFDSPRMVILDSGNVGLGMLNPKQAKLVVNGGVNAVPTNTGISYFSEQDNPGVVNRFNSQSAFDRKFIGQTTSIYASGNIWSGYSIVSSSDERIKDVQARSDGAADLRTLLGIEITDYRYKDVIGKGDGAYKKVIGQQVLKVFPQAVSRHTDVVPDIYRQAAIHNGWVALATDLKRGERVKLITEQGTEDIHEVIEVAPDKFRVAFQHEEEKVFVFGREVDDFLTVDYDAIAMLNVSATQQLKKDNDEAAKALRTENAGLKARLDDLESVVEKLLLSGGTPAAHADATATGWWQKTQGK